MYEKTVNTLWMTLLVIIGIALICLTLYPVKTHAADINPKTAFILIAILAFFMEYVDSSLGMGYGTTLTPLLMILGFSPASIVPAVLLSELVSGISAGILHHTAGNVYFGLRSRTGKTVIILSLCSAVGCIVATLLTLKLPKVVVKIYIGLMVFSIGVFMIMFKNRPGKFSWKKIVTLGTIAAFNKGISGGGYGPIVTGGQILSGISGKNAIAITSLAEGIVCAIGLGLHTAFGGAMDWNLAIPMLTGALISVPAAAFTVKIMPERNLSGSIGYATVFLGTLILAKLIL